MFFFFEFLFQLNVHDLCLFFHGFDKYYETEDVTSAVSFQYTLSDPGNKIITVNWNEENAVP